MVPQGKSKPTKKHRKKQLNIIDNKKATVSALDLRRVRGGESARVLEVSIRGSG